MFNDILDVSYSSGLFIITKKAIMFHRCLSVCLSVNWITQQETRLMLTNCAMHLCNM